LEAAVALAHFVLDGAFEAHVYEAAVEHTHIAYNSQLASFLG
jgi:hypothetical protein